MILAPDTEQKAIYEASIAPHLKPGDALVLRPRLQHPLRAHRRPTGVDVAMVAPKGPGHLVRRTYDRGRRRAGLIAVAQDATGKARDLALSYADAIGGTRAGVLETTFAEETETDLFGEQVVLCGGLTSLVQAGFETLVEAGYQPEIGLLRVPPRGEADRRPHVRGGHRRHALLDLRHRRVRRPHPRARASSTTRCKAEMKKILDEIQSGQFADEWIAENRAGRPNFNRLREAGAEHPIEKVGAELRAMMPCITAGSGRIQDVSGG